MGALVRPGSGVLISHESASDSDPADPPGSTPASSSPRIVVGQQRACSRVRCRNPVDVYGKHPIRVCGLGHAGSLVSLVSV